MENTEKENQETIEEPKEINDRTLLSEIRNLLNNYPLTVVFDDSEDVLGLAKNFITIYDLINHCKHKSLKENFKKRFEEELDLFKENGLDELEKNYLLYKSSTTNIGAGQYRKKITLIITPNINFIKNKVQMYILAMPIKGKANMHLKSAIGLPGANAEEFESSEVSDGIKVGRDQPFKVVDEGRIELAED